MRAMTRRQLLARLAGRRHRYGWFVESPPDPDTIRFGGLFRYDYDLDAGPVATVGLPARIPYGFHATWVTTAD